MDRHPLQLADQFDLDGVLTPRVFLSAKSGDGLPTLRQLLASAVGVHPSPVNEAL